MHVKAPLTRFGLASALLLGLLASLTWTSSQPALAATPTAAAVNLYNVETQRCADVPGFANGRLNGPVLQYRCNYTSQDNQRFLLLPNGSHEGFPVYLFRNAKDGLCLDLPDFGAVPARTRVSEYHCRPSGDNQSFFAQPVGDGSFLYRHVKSPSLCLDVEFLRARADDVHLMLWPCSPAQDDHLWVPVADDGQVRALLRGRAERILFGTTLNDFGALRVRPKVGFDNSFDWGNDGCSNPMGRINVQAAVANRYFRAACERHDLAYRNMGKGLGLARDENMRRRIDDALLADSRYLCGHLGLANVIANCYTAAGAYWTAVRHFGRSSYYP
jgi:hypothetical protein